MHPKPLDKADHMIAAKLAECHLQAFDDGWTEEDFTKLLALNASIGMMAMDDAGQMLGFVLAHAVADVADIITIAVHPSQQGKAIGTKLMQALEATLTALGVTEIFLEVRLSNIAAQKLYSSLHYAHIATRSAYYSTANGDEDGLLMKKTL